MRTRQGLGRPCHMWFYFADLLCLSKQEDLMRCRTFTIFGLTFLLLLVPDLRGAERAGFELTVLVDGIPRDEYHARGTTYVEALRGRSYELRVTNPLPYRVGVALSVDGLNSIDAKHTTASKASKWVIEPYDSIVISGWQVNEWAARQFFFTGERHSYGAALGKTENLGVIEAAFFREKAPVRTWRPAPIYERDDARGQERSRAEGQTGRAAPESGVQAAPTSKDALSDEHAATGMGERRRHEVEQIRLELEKEASAVVRIRYEFRPQLVSLGIFPTGRTPMDRRERARGFGTWAPEVDR